MLITHISDTHTFHDEFTIPASNVLVHTGDIGGRTNLKELTEFLIWFERQPADRRIFIAGNHDLILDKLEPVKEKMKGNMYGWSKALDDYKRALDLIASYDVVYLNNTDYVYDGVKFWGSPYSPSFHRMNWCFNADRGAEISKQWAKIPSDVDVLLTHTPVYGILDDLKECADPGEDPHAGCKDLLNVIKKRLLKLRLHCSGHLHANYGVLQQPISNSRNCLFSNGALLTNQYKLLIQKPLIITI